MPPLFELVTSLGRQTVNFPEPVSRTPALFGRQRVPVTHMRTKALPLLGRHVRMTVNHAQPFLPSGRFHPVPILLKRRQCFFLPVIQISPRRLCVSRQSIQTHHQTKPGRCQEWFNHVSISSSRYASTGKSSTSSNMSTSSSSVSAVSNRAVCQ